MEYACPKGHQSTEPDFCSECGAKIRPAAPPQPVTPPPVPAAAPMFESSGEMCPDCGTPRSADGGAFCEICGYNFVTGARGEIPQDFTPPPAPPPPVPPQVVPPQIVPQPPVPPMPPGMSLAPDPPVPPPAAAPAAWSVMVAVDPSLRESGSPDPPAGAGPFTYKLDKAVNLIGRRSKARAIFPEVPLDYDEAVSHRHALLTFGDDGALALRDIGSANGTRLNGKDVPPMTDAAVRDGDQITLGHWSRITVKGA